MPEPTINTALAATVGASSASFTAGTVLGVEYAVIGIALLGGATALIYLDKMKWRQMLASIAGATIIGVVLAVLCTYLIVPTVVHFAPWLADVLVAPYLPAKTLIAFVGGFTAQKAMPAALRYIDKQGG